MKPKETATAQAALSQSLSVIRNVGEADLSDFLATTAPDEVHALVKKLRALATQLEAGLVARNGALSVIEGGADDAEVEDYFDNMPV
jgi:hypothetical protein